MKKISLFLGITLLALHVNSVYAVEQWHVNLVVVSEQWHAALVKVIYPLDDGSFILVFVTDSTTCTATAPKYHYVTPGANGMTVEGAKKIFSVAALAVSMNKELQVAFDDS